MSYMTYTCRSFTSAVTSFILRIRGIIKICYGDLWHQDLLYVYFYNISASNQQFDAEFSAVAAASPSSCSPGDGRPVQPADVPKPMVRPATDERGSILKIGNIEYTR